MASSKIITQRLIDSLKSGQTLTDPAPKGAGTLQVRKLTSGSVAFYFRYTDECGKRHRLPLGCDIALANARAQAKEHSTRYQTQDRNLREAIRADQDAERQKRAEEQAVAAKEASRKQATLGKLLLAYVAELERNQKKSAVAVRGALVRHVELPWADLWSTAADDVTTEELVDVLARLTEQSKNREAEKLRSYLNSAYKAGIKARQNAKAGRDLRDLKITSNPAGNLVAIEGASGARERALSVEELRAYWRRILALPPPTGALLRFHLLTGGQRMEQLARVQLKDFDQESNFIRIIDLKGRRQAGRTHDIPVIGAAMEALKEMGQQLGPYLFTITQGESGVDPSSVHRRVAGVARDMELAGELLGARFSPSDIRRTVETRLAALKVAKEARAQLQSHGLSGVQDRHYDKHSYLEEKREALEMLFQLVSGKDDVSLGAPQSPALRLIVGAR